MGLPKPGDERNSDHSQGINRLGFLTKIECVELTDPGIAETCTPSRGIGEQTVGHNMVTRVLVWLQTPYMYHIPDQARCISSPRSSTVSISLTTISQGSYTKEQYEQKISSQ